MIGKEAFMNILSVLLCYALYIKNVVYIVSDKKMNSLEGMAKEIPIP
jgi:dihydroneopterin aldolase